MIIKKKNRQRAKWDQSNYWIVPIISLHTKGKKKRQVKKKVRKMSP